MPATRTSHNSTSDLDLSRASPVTNNPTTINHLTNDPGSATLGVSVGKAKRQPLKRSGSGSNSGSAQSLIGFSSRKAGPVTPEKKKKTVIGARVTGVKRNFEHVDLVSADDEDEDTKTTATTKTDGKKETMHPVFALSERTTTTTAPSVQQPPSSITFETSTALTGISGVPQNGAWDPLLLSHSGTTNPTKAMQDNLAPPPSRDTTDLEPTPAEQVEEFEETDDQAGQAGHAKVGRTIRGLAVRKAMLRADAKIRLLCSQKPSSLVSTTATKSKTASAAGGAGKAKTASGKSSKEKKKEGSLDPNDKRWNGVYKAAWELMGGADITPSTSPVIFHPIHHV